MLGREVEDELRDDVDVVERRVMSMAAGEMEVRITKSRSVHSGLSKHRPLGLPVSGPSG